MTFTEGSLCVVMGNYSFLCSIQHEIVGLYFVKYYAPDETENIKFVPSIKSPKISPRETQKLGGQCKLSRTGQESGTTDCQSIAVTVRQRCLLEKQKQTGRTNHTCSMRRRNACELATTGTASDWLIIGHEVFQPIRKRGYASKANDSSIQRKTVAKA